MSQIANVEYFYLKCNQILLTSYTSSDWGGEGNKYKAINIEWLSLATNKVYNDIHKPKSGCNLKLSVKFNNEISKIAVDKVLVDDVINYLKNLNKICDNDCACYRDLNCNCVCSNHCNCQTATACSGPGNCTNATACTCNCNCNYTVCNCTGVYNCNCNCDCECGNNTECVCDCDNYECNCNQTLNCNYGSKRPSTQNCGTACNCSSGNCNCACECKPPPPPPECNPTGGGGGQGGGGGGSGNCQGSVCTYTDGTNCVGDYAGNPHAPTGPGTNTSSEACGGGGGGGGGGSCFTADTLIETESGFKRMDELIINKDKVKTANGFELVTDIFRMPTSGYHIIYFEDGSETKVTDDHPIILPNGHCKSLDGNARGMDNVLTMTRLKVGDQIWNKKIIDIKYKEDKTLTWLPIVNDWDIIVNDIPWFTCKSNWWKMFSNTKMANVISKWEMGGRKITLLSLFYDYILLNPFLLPFIRKLRISWNCNAVKNYKI